MQVTVQKRCSKKLYNIHKKIPVLESFCRPSSLQFFQKKSPTLIFFCELGEIFKNTYFKEHLQTTASYFMKKKKKKKIDTAED